jgi:RNA polymerase sigma factor (sigma-70 family)
LENSERLRVLVVDDSPLFRQGLASLLNSRRDMQVVGEAGDGFEALEKTRETVPDVVLMDIIMPDCDGLEATRRIKQEMPHVQIVMLTVSESEDNLFEAIKLGARGYLLKDVGAEELLRVLRGLSRGETYVAPGIAARILQEFARPSRTTEALSGREQEVLKLVTEGLSNKEISQSLGISPSTVKNHLRNIMEKLHVRNRVEAAIRFLNGSGLADHG